MENDNTPVEVAEVVEAPPEAVEAPVAEVEAVEVPAIEETPVVEEPTEEKPDPSARIAELEALLLEATTAIETQKADVERGKAWSNTGIENSAVQEYAVEQYGKTDKALGFSEWLDGQRENPLLASHFRSEAPPAPVEAPAHEETTPVADRLRSALSALTPEAGITQAKTSRDMSLDDVRRQRAQNGGVLESGDMAALMNQLRASGLIK